MLNPFKTRLSSLQWRYKLKRKQSKQPEKRSHDFDLLTTIPPFSTMDLTTHFRQIFKQMDKDGDGKISSYELSQLLLCLGYEKSEIEKQAEELVRDMDCNGDGFVDLDEFIGSLMNNGGSSRSEEEYDDDDDDDVLKDVFSVFDVDKNGLISAQELHKVMIRLKFDDESCSVEDCKRMINGVDKDGDGFVDFQEFQAMMRSSMC